MKKCVSMLTASLLLGGLLFSCKPEQSELNVDALPGTATVTGKVEYNPGVTKVGDAYITDYKAPAAGRTVCVKVYTSEFTGAEDETGNYRSFRATTDEKGRYSVSVPVGYNPIEAEVTALPFIAEKTVQDSEDKLITLENAVYKTAGKTVMLEDQSIADIDLLMTSAKQMDVEYDQKVSLNGTVLAATLKRPADSDAELYDTLTGYASELTVRVEVGGDNGSTQKYTVQSDASGRYKLDMMLPNNCWENTVRITVSKEAAIDEFKHYYRKYSDTKWSTQTVEVFYQGSKSTTLESRHKLVPVEMPTLELMPAPVYPEKVYGIGSEIDNEYDIEEHNPLGW